MTSGCIRERASFSMLTGFHIHTFTQTGSLQHPRQYYLAPVAPDFIVAFQRTRQVDRFPGHLGVELLEVADFVSQGMTFLGFFTKAVPT